MTDAEYTAAIEGWREKNEAKLASPTGWLALTGHYWLQRGDQRLGTTSDAAIALPKELGDQVRGMVTVDGNRVWLRCEEDSGIRVNGDWKAEAELKIDATKIESDSTDQITIGDRIRIQLVRRNGRFAIRVRDAESEILRRFTGKRWFPVDRRYCVQATYHAYESPQMIRIVNVRGDETTAEIVGYVEMDLLGKPIRIDAMLDSPTELFLIFRDRTNGKSTYGSGRFLNAPLPEDGATFELDFNQTYNPPCVFSPHTLCPMPPKQNHLDLEIEAGERMPR